MLESVSWLADRRDTGVFAVLEMISEEIGLASQIHK